MDGRRQIQLAEEITHLAGEFIAREYGASALITVTRSHISPDLKEITIYVSVLPQEGEKEALVFLKRSRSDFREYLKSKGALSRIPTVDFEIDWGEKNRQRVDELTRS